jgi:hypothetical protein
MALSATTVWEIRTTGNVVNGGGFAPGSGGTDYTLQDYPQASGTNLTVDTVSSTDVTPDGYTPLSADVGNIIQVTAGAGFTTGFYQVQSIQSGKWRLDRSPAALSATGGSWYLGGALNSIAPIASGIVVGGNDVYIKSGTYSTTSSIVMTISGTAPIPIRIIGYNTNRDWRNTDTQPTITSATSGVHLFATNGSTYVHWYNMKFTHTGSTRGWIATNNTVQSYHFYWRCTIDGVRAVALPSSSGSLSYEVQSAYYCEFKNCLDACMGSGNGTAVRFLYGCYVHDNSASGYTLTNTGNYMSAVNTVFAKNAAEGVYLSRSSTQAPYVTLLNCIFYKNTGSGVRWDTNAGVNISNGGAIDNCVFWGGAYGVRRANSGNENWCGSFQNNAFGGQSTAAKSNISLSGNDITLTVDPFIDGDNGNFALNNEPGGGALLKNAGYPLSLFGSNVRWDVGLPRKRPTISV